MSKIKVTINGVVVEGEAADIAALMAASSAPAAAAPAATPTNPNKNPLNEDGTVTKKSNNTGKEYTFNPKTHRIFFCFAIGGKHGGHEKGCWVETVALKSRKDGYEKNELRSSVCAAANLDTKAIRALKALNKAKGAQPETMKPENTETKEDSEKVLEMKGSLEDMVQAAAQALVNKEKALHGRLMLEIKKASNLAAEDMALIVADVKLAASKLQPTVTVPATETDEPSL